MATHLFVLQNWMTTLESRSEIKNEYVLMISWYILLMVFNSFKSSKPIYYQVSFCSVSIDIYHIQP